MEQDLRDQKPKQEDAHEEQFQLIDKFLTFQVFWASGSGCRLQLLTHKKQAETEQHNSRYKSGLRNKTTKLRYHQN